MAKCSGHKWLLNIGVSPIVVCGKCFVQFKPPNQQVPWHGAVPDKFKDAQ